jgi:Holliday junction resolvase
MGMVPGGNRNKGHDAEREIVKLLTPMVEMVLGESNLRRNLQQSRQGGHDICGLDYLAIEVKRCETLEVEKWWRQTLRQAEMAGGLLPILMYRQNRGKWNVLMFGRIGNMITRVQIDMESFGAWLTEDLRDRVRRGEILARSGFYEKDGQGVGDCLKIA